MKAFLCLATLACGLLGGGSTAAMAEGKAFTFGDPKQYELTAPANWESKEPRNRIVEFEFETPKAEGDDVAGRVTVMGALGGVKANVDRWIGQFQPAENGEPVKPVEKKLTIAGKEVHVVDLKGTYIDRPAGPFAGGTATDRPGYRMLGAIVQTKDGGDYFVKLYGPEKTIAAAEPGFMKMLETLKAK